CCAALCVPVRMAAFAAIRDDQSWFPLIAGCRCCRSCRRIEGTRATGHCLSPLHRGARRRLPVATSAALGFGLVVGGPAGFCLGALHRGPRRGLPVATRPTLGF